MIFFKWNVCSNLLSDCEFHENYHSKIRTSHGGVNSFIAVLSVLSDLSDIPCKGGHTLVTLPRIVTPYRDIVDETRARITYQKLVTR